MEIVNKKCTACGGKNMVKYNQRLIKTYKQTLKEMELGRRLVDNDAYCISEPIPANYYMCLDCGHLELYATDEKFESFHNQIAEEKEFANYIDSLKSELEQLEKSELPKHNKAIEKLTARVESLKAQVADENISVKKHNELIEEIKKTEYDLHDYPHRCDYQDCVNRIEFIKTELKTGEHYKLNTIDMKSDPGWQQRNYQILTNQRLMTIYLQNHQ